MDQLWVYDTTLRDGTQGENVNFSAEDKLNIAHRLDEFGVHYIEGGWPGSNPRDIQFFDIAKRVEFKNARLAAFGSTCKPETVPEDDTNLQAILQSDTPVVTIFGKSWILHVEQIMKNRPAENLRMINESVAYLKSQNKEVIYDAEHFFDGYKDNAEYALKTLQAAVAAGADFIVLCDTNGGTLPSEIESVTDEVRQSLVDANTADDFSIKIGTHTHNDSGLAVANSIAAINFPFSNSIIP